jgi:hypothetical protein
MKELLYRLPSNRSFAKLFSLLAVAFAAFVAAEAFFVQQALAGTGSLCCKINTLNCPSGSGTTGAVLAGNHYCEGSTTCNTNYRFERTSTGAKKVCYSNVTPPSDSTSFTLSGPLTVCQFYRPDLPEDVQVSVDSLALGDIAALPGPHEYRISGMAVCSLANEVEEHRLFVDVDLRIGCGTRTASGNAITHSLLFSALDNQTRNCQNGLEAISGSYTGRADPPPFGDMTPGSPLWRMLTYCGGGAIPEDTPTSDVTTCVLRSGIDADASKSIFEKKVCGPKGEIFAMKETIVSGGEFHGGKVAVCSCQGDLDGSDAICPGPGDTIEVIKTNAEAASQCEFDWQNAVAGDVIDLNGNNPVNAAIYDGPGCNVNEIVKSSLRACGGNVTPTQIKVGTSQGRLALNMKISEPACVADLANLVAGQTRDIDITGTFNDGTRFVGSDDVFVLE